MQVGRDKGTKDEFVLSTNDFPMEAAFCEVGGACAGGRLTLHWLGPSEFEAMGDLPTGMCCWELVWRAGIQSWELVWRAGIQSGDWVKRWKFGIGNIFEAVGVGETVEERSQSEN